MKALLRLQTDPVPNAEALDLLQRAHEDQLEPNVVPAC